MIAAVIAILAVQDSSRLTLVDAVQRALGQYPTVAVARAQADRARADVGETRAAQLPRLNLDFTATRWSLPAVAFPLHGIPSATNPVPPGGQLVFDEQTYQGNLLLNWTFFDFGARRGRTRASRMLSGAADEALTNAQQQLAARTAAQYLRVLTGRQTLAAQDQQLEALTREADRTRRLFAEGKAPRLEVLRADAELARARAARSAVAGQLDVAEHDVAQLVGVTFEQLHGSALSDAHLRDTIVSARTDLVAQAQQASPSLREATQRTQAADASAGAARATRLPELRLSAGYIPRASSDEVRTEWQAGLGVSWPLYTGGQRSSQIDRAEADARAGHEQLRLAQLTVAQDVDRALAAVVEARSRVGALEAAVEASEAVAETERTALEVGAGTQTDYFDALTDVLRERAGLIDARHNEVAARIELARVTGTLSPDALVQLLEDR
jgi:outer membrane protein